MSDIMTHSHQRKTFMLDLTDDAILHSLLFYHFLRADQICHLHFSPGSLTWVRSRRLKLLIENKYAQLVMGKNKKPMKPYVYALHNRGRRYLQDLGTDVPRRFNASEQIKKALLFLEHTLAINDVLIAASLLERDVEDITLARMLHEVALRSNPLHVTYQQKVRQGGETSLSQTLVPDGWIDVYLDDKKAHTEWRFSIWLEVDRGTIQARNFKKKVRAILEYLKTGNYQKQFSSNVILVAFITTQGQQRVDKIRTWIQEEAVRTNDETWANNLFLTTAFPPGTLDPILLFFSPIWLHPGNDTGVALVHT